MDLYSNTSNMKQQGHNPGFDPAAIAELEAEALEQGRPFVWNHDEPNTDQTAHFRFVGEYEGQRAIYDGVMYTLRLEYGARLYELAEAEAKKHFTKFEPMVIHDEDDPGQAPTYPPEVEEFIAEVIYQLQEEEEVKVREHFELDDQFGNGIGLEVCLNVDEISEEIISRFVEDFRGGNFRPDPTLYSFEEDDED